MSSTMDEENQQQNALDVTVEFPHFVRPEVVPDNQQSADKVIDDADYEKTYIPKQTVFVRDARPLQGPSLTEANASKFFQEKSFCLFPQKTNVKKWNEDYIKGMMFGSDISRVYAPEIEAIIRNNLLSDYHIAGIDFPPAVLRRGPGSKNNFYGTGVHQDFGLTLVDYKKNLDAYDPTGGNSISMEYKFKEEGVCGIMIINFWRPIGGYTTENPLLSNPLAVCDPSGVDTSDTLHTALDAKKFGGVKDKLTDQMGLKYSPKQEWFYYSKMTDDEVLAFKQFEFWHTDIDVKRENFPVRGCFHTAFQDPNTPENSPPRKSTEFRVTVFVGKKKTSEEISKGEKWIPPAPLWPKTSSEWGTFCLDFASIGMIFATVFAECPAIPGALGFVFSFCIIGLILGSIKFTFSLKREGRKELHPCAKVFTDILGVAQLCTGIWGMVLSFPNLSYLANPSPDTCEIGPMVSIFIPALIIAVVIAGIVVMGIYYTVVPKKSENA